MADTVLRTSYVEFRHGSSDKFYRLVLWLDGGGQFTVTATWGRRGTPGQSGSKYAGNGQTEAGAAFDRAEGAKLGKGYLAVSDPLASAGPGRAVLYGPVGSPPQVVQTIPANQALNQMLNAASARTRPILVGTPQKMAPPAQMPPRFPVQLAGEHPGALERALAAPNDFVFEEKFDGFRALIAFCPDYHLEVRNRYGEDKGRIGNIPFIEAELRRMGALMPGLWDGTLIDGELVGRSWEETAHLLGAAGRIDSGLRFMAFDLPYLAGADLRGRDYEARRSELTGIMTPIVEVPTLGPLQLVEQLAPATGLVQSVWARGGEGVIIKTRAEHYVPGDRTVWSKVKESHTAEAVITGFEPGKGKYAGKVGAVILSQYRRQLDGNSVLVEVCRASGMSDAVRNSLDDSWLRRVVEFAYQVKTADSFRHPRWLRLRDDKRPTDCHWEASA